MLGTARVEPLIRKIRNAMEAAGVQVENSKGECNLGQHEINFRYSDALTAADGHVIYKEAAKEIAAEAGSALTFMAKVQRARGQFLPYASQPARCPPAKPCSWMTTGIVHRIFSLSFSPV